MLRLFSFARANGNAGTALARPLLWLALIAIVVFVHLHGFLLRNQQPTTDFKSFYVAFQVAAAEGDIYDLGRLRAQARASGVRGPIFPYLYPPLFAHAFAALGELELQSALRVWHSLCFVALVLLVFLTSALARKACPPAGPAEDRRLGGPGASALLIALLMVFMQPFTHNFYMGQSNVIVLAFLVGCLYCWQADRQLPAGAFLALATMIKLTPALLLLFFLARRRFRLLGSFAATAVVLAGVSLLLGDPGEWAAFGKTVWAVGQGTHIEGLAPVGHVANASLLALAIRTLPAGAAPLIAKAACLAGAVGLCWLAARTRSRSAAAPLLLSFLSLVILVPPYTWYHHQILLYPALVLVLAAARRIDWFWVTVMLAAALLNLNWWRVFQWLELPELDATPISTFALVALVGLGIWRNRALVKRELRAAASRSPDPDPQTR